MGHGGPGESQLEMDRRLIQERISKIKGELETVVKTRDLHRKGRERVPFPIVALVGYTNAGKSTLFNKLTSANVLAKDLLFATLDPTMRNLTLPSGRTIILSDTVGFISELPTTRMTSPTAPSCSARPCAVSCILGRLICMATSWPRKTTRAGSKSCGLSAVCSGICRRSSPI